MTKQLNVLAIQHVLPETPGLIADAITSAGHDLQMVRVFDNDPISQTIAPYAALVVMGGPMGVYEADRYPHLKDEMGLIEDALRNEKPVLGVCLGSQLLASVLGANVRPGSSKEIGWYPVRLTDSAHSDQLFTDAPSEFTPLHWHGDIFDLPAGATPLASSDQTALQAFRYGRSAYGLLFHLEMTPPMVHGIATMFADEARSADAYPEKIIADSGKKTEALVPFAPKVFAGWTRLVGT